MNFQNIFCSAIQQKCILFVERLDEFRVAFESRGEKACVDVNNCHDFSFNRCGIRPATLMFFSKPSSPLQFCYFSFEQDTVWLSMCQSDLPMAKILAFGFGLVFFPLFSPVTPQLSPFCWSSSQYRDCVWRMVTKSHHLCEKYTQALLMGASTQCFL